MPQRRKTFQLEDLRTTTNRAIAHAGTREERLAFAHVWESVTLPHDNAYRGFKYVDENDVDVSHEVVGSGQPYDETRRYYF